MRRFLRVLAAVCVIATPLAIPFVVAGGGAKGIIAGATAFLVLCGLLPVLMLTSAWLRHRRTLAAARLLERAAIARGPFGFATHVRGLLGGTAVVISRSGAALDDASRTLLVPARELRGLLGDRDALAARLAVALSEHRAGSLVRAASAGATCPYCKDAIAPRESEGAVRCDSCESVHHTPCWKEHGGCSVHGCRRTPGDRVRE